MVTIANFSRPMRATKALCSLVGTDDVKIVDIPTQVDLGEPLIDQADRLIDQADRLIDQAVEEAGGNPRNIDIIRLPGLSGLAAVLLRRFEARHRYLPHLVRIARDGGTPPIFDAVELIKANHLR